MRLCRVGSVGSEAASQMVGREFASRPGHTKDHHKSGTNCLPAWHAMRYGRSLAVQPDCLKGREVCGTVYGDMHLKDLLGSFVRVGYCILVPVFYLVLHGLGCRKKHYNGLNQTKLNMMRAHAGLNVVIMGARPIWLAFVLKEKYTQFHLTVKMKD